MFSGPFPPRSGRRPRMVPAPFSGLPVFGPEGASGSPSWGRFRVWLRSGRKRPLPLDAFPPFTRSPLFSHRVVWRRSPDRFQPFLAFHDWEVGQTGKRAAVGPWSLQRRRQGRGPAVSRAPGGCSGSLVRAPGGAVSPVSPRVGRGVSCGAAGQPHRPRSAATGAGRRRSGE